MSNYSSNVDPNKPKEFPRGKCADEFPEEDYTKIQESNAPDVDMGSYSRKEKKSGY